MREADGIINIKNHNFSRLRQNKLSLKNKKQPRTQTSLKQFQQIDNNIHENHRISSSSSHIQNIDSVFKKLQIDQENQNKVNQQQCSYSQNQQNLDYKLQDIRVSSFILQDQNKIIKIQEKQEIQQPKVQKKAEIVMPLKKYQAHLLIKYILQKNKKKVIQHQINIVKPQTVLYRSYYNFNPNKELININEMNKQLNDQHYKTLNKCGKKLNEVYNKIKDQFKSLDQLNKKSQAYKSSKSQKKISFSTKKKSSFNSIQDNPEQQKCIDGQSLSQRIRAKKRQKKKNDRVLSVSGIVNYKFKSIKSEKHLVYNPLQNRSDQKQLENDLNKIKLRVECPIERTNKIEYRSAKQKAIKQMKKKQIALRQSLTKMQYSKLSTDQYLQKVKINKRNVSRIYGQEQNRLNYINYLMNHQNLERNLAQFSVDFIVEKIKTEGNQNTNRNIKSVRSMQKLTYRSQQLNDEKVLDNRKQISYKIKNLKGLKQIKSKNGQNIINNRSRVLLNNLSFISEYD